MSDLIVGMLFAKNEGDIITEVLTEFSKKVDIIYAAEDSSTDNTYDLMKSFRDKNKDKLVHLQRDFNKNDPAQRNSLLHKIRKRHDPKKTWVQVCEGDVLLLDTDVREAISKYAVNDLAVSWQMINATRKGWTNADLYPNWDQSIKEVLPLGHFMEVLLYTFRPVPELFFSPTAWRPYPKGFAKCTKLPLKRNRKFLDSPLLLHVGYRSPTMFYNKYKHMGNFHTKYKTWELTSPESVLRTVPFFNGQYAEKAFPANREGWVNWCKARNPNLT